MAPKIVTCSYCGTRAALVLSRGRHELVCSSCGAPIHDIKMMPQTIKNKKENPPLGKPVKGRNKVHGIDRTARRTRPPAGRYQRARKKSGKPLSRRIFEELWDTVEDVFD